MTKKIPIHRIIAFSALLLLAIAIGWERYVLNPKTDIEHFKDTLIHKELEAETFISKIKQDLDLTKLKAIAKKNSEKDNTIYLVYEDKELIYWSNNLINVPEVYENSFYEQALLSLNNGYYVVHKQNFQNRKFVALIPIYYRYTTSNSFLQNHFDKDFKLTYQTRLTNDATKGHFISNKDGKYLFSLLQSKKLNKDTTSAIFPSLLYLLIILLFWYAATLDMRRLRPKQQAIFIGVSTTLILIIRSLTLNQQIPNTIYSLEFFTPNLHASSSIFRSLGDYWLNALGLFLWLYLVSLYKWNKAKMPKQHQLFISILLTLGMIITSLFIFKQVESLVINSSFSLQVHKGSGIEIYSVWAYAGAALFFSSILLLIRIITHYFNKTFHLEKFYKVWGGLFCISILTVLFFDKILAFHLFYLMIIGILRGRLRYNSKTKLRYIIKVFILFVSALYLTVIINIYSQEKEIQIRSAKAESIIDSNNPKTKALLETTSSSWNEDKTLLHFFQDPIKNENLIKEHIRSQYFSRSWSDYNIQINICTQNDVTDVKNAQNENTPTNCFENYSTLLHSAVRIGNSPFYELKTQKGITPYIGILSFITEKYGEIRLFIRLDLKPYSDKVGYTKLLNNKNEKGNYENYSYAKYINNELRYSSGDYDYYRTFSKFNSPNEKENYFIHSDQYTHYIYNVTDSYKIVVSSKKLSLYKRYIAFPYIFFLLLFIFSTIWILETSFPRFTQIGTFRKQIQIALVVMISLVFLIVGGVSLYYNFTSKRYQYEEEHKSKIQMLRRELFANIENTRDLIPHFNPKVQENLENYSRILGADINIYDIYGVLIVTSEPEIYSKELLSNRMNYKVLQKLTSLGITETTEQEHIGDLEYSSVYVTLWNNKNEPIAYLNVPYFMKYNEFKAEMQDIIVGVLNINLILIILALALAFIISQQITHPLVLLREKFAKLRLDKANEKIDYRKKDEIKVVVDAYNKMVDELGESAKLLAQSERESAWREMAQQVAHEIKNPLTPMKLNIQFLQRSLAHKSEDWEDKFSELSNVLLTQIDELSAIASAFSDFAKLPQEHKENFDLIGLLRELVVLYDKGKTALNFETEIENANIFADNNQLRRAFINLITNAIQATNKTKNGIVKVRVHNQKASAIKIEITDNGTGIPKEIRSKIFTPNFTTKNSGMGLGLALTKDIINQTGGKISFESEEGKGTTFCVILPSV